jgi:hypothetical protein
VFRYGGLQPLDAAEQQLPITLIRDTGRPVTLIRLAGLRRHDGRLAVRGDAVTR